MWQVIVRIPAPYFPDGIPIYGFGLMLFFAFVLCTWLAGRLAMREGIKNETVQDLALWIFLGGLLGARITYLLSERWDGLWSFIQRLPMIWEGGIVLYGSVIGGLVSYYVAKYLYFGLMRKESIHTRRLIDSLAPAIALGLCLGRIGCLLNGCCFGGVACASCPGVTPITFPLCAPPRESLISQGFQSAAGFTIDPYSVKSGGVRVTAVDPTSEAYKTGLRPGAIIVGVNGKEVQTTTDLDLLLGHLDRWPRGQSVLELEYKPTAKAEAETHVMTPRTLGLYPTQLYEVISMALLMFVLLAYYPLRRNPGQVCAVLMVGYGIHRYLNEILRDDPRPEGFEKYGSVLLVSAGAILWLWLSLKPTDPPVTPIEPRTSDKATTPA